ncbi:hypothetical protein FOA52_001847 [Chlamydomonas sp. UWO 241]|nr:hypothetical protein FOA52_001847 [Chlamydomonas sp. UWO 241]
MPQPATAGSADPPGVASGALLPEAADEAWGSGAGSRLLIMQWDGAASRDVLAGVLHGAGAVIGAYIPQDAWLVAAGEGAVAAAELVPGVSIAEYPPQHRVAPEWQPALAAIDALLADGGSDARGVLSAWEAGSPTSTPLDALARTARPPLRPVATARVSFPSGLPDAPGAASAEWPALLAALLAGSGPACAPDVVSSGPRAVLASVGGVPNGAVYSPNSWQFTPFARFGIDGRGQIIGVGDTGLALDSCFFYDPDAPLTAANATIDPVTGVTVIRPASHRKLVQYYGYRSLEDESGHGTHVSGTLVGDPIMSDAIFDQTSSAAAAVAAPGDGSASALWDPSEARGLAPGAKLAFYDLLDNSTGASLTPPTDLMSEYLAVQYRAGARVQSDSWGYDGSFAYTDSSAQIDTFAWYHPDFLMVFAVGNHGANTSARDGPFDAYGLLPEGTVSSPANAKNVIAVGSVLNLVPAQEGTHIVLSFSAVDLNGRTRNATAVQPTVSLDFGSHLPLYATPSLRVVIAEPYLACSPLGNATGTYDPRGAVLIVGRGACNFNAKVVFAASAGAAAVVIVNYEDAGLLPGVNPDKSSMPVSAVPLSVGRIILGLIGVALPEDASSVSLGASLPRAPPGAGVSLRIAVTAAEEGTPFEHVADFSGYGPIVDGRIKPDLVAPGSTLLSAHGTGRATGTMDACGMARLQGTSMSTPMVAAAAALVRQYFASGFYPSGMKRQKNVYATPSGMLVKAVLVAGAAPVKGNSYLLGRPLAEVEPACGLSQTTNHKPPTIPEEQSDSGSPAGEDEELAAGAAAGGGAAGAAV